MSRRIAQADLEQMIVVVNNRVRPPKGKRYELEHGYGKVRMILEDTRLRTARDISPLLPKPLLYMWMSAFIEGAEAHERR